MIKKLLLGGLALVALGGAAFAGFGAGAPPEDVARESLDLLKAMRQHSALAETYLAGCVTAIAYAKRLETRKEAGTELVRSVWLETAGRCRGMANAVCDASALQAPHEACNRIRAFDPVL